MSYGLTTAKELRNDFFSTYQQRGSKVYAVKENVYVMNIDTDQILNEVRAFADALTHYSETAKSDSFLRCYADIPDFLAISADGMIRNYEDFRKICKSYYESLKAQKINTTYIKYHVLDPDIVVFCWSGDIDAYFKNGDTMKMQNYTATYLCRKIGGEWKIIHSHDSALPAQIIKSK